MRKIWLLGFIFWVSSALADDYATDFGKCATHFWQGIPPATVFDPSGKSQYPLCFTGFATLYSGVSNTAIYSAHHLTKDDIKNARQLDRKDSFRPEPRLPKRHQTQLKDYKNSGFDRGHLVPNGDMPNRQKQYDSYSLANIIPQNSEQNRGVWQQIESHTRTLTANYGESYIVTGTVFAGRPQKLADMTIPSHTYKAVYVPSQNIAAAYYSPNNASGTYEVIDLNELQNRVGVVAFPSVNARFAPNKFDLDSRFDGSQASQAGDEGFFNFFTTLLVRLWQALG